MIDEKHWGDCVSLDNYDRALLKDALGSHRRLLTLLPPANIVKERTMEHIDALVERLDK